MIEPQAVQLGLHEPPRFSLQSLNELHRLLAVALSVLDAAKSSHQDEGAA
jgi:hypothetical protein